MPLASRLTWPRPRSTAPLVRFLRGLWTLPTNVFGHLAGRLVSGGPPRAVTGLVARGWLYAIRPGLGLDWVGAVTLGHVILHRPGLFVDPAAGRAGRCVLAHELAHTRQHDVLGPLYLPAHVLAQSLSALVAALAPGPIRSAVHDWNPLEHTFICLGASAYGELARGARLPEADVERYLARFGV